MKSRNRIIRWRKRFPLMRPIDMARKLNVSRQYVYKILKKYDLPTSAPPQRKVRHCPICYDIVPTRAKVCPGRCRYEYTNIQVTCSFCTYKFLRKRWQIISCYRRGYQNIYCSRSCYYKSRRDKFGDKQRSDQAMGTED